MSLPILPGATSQSVYIKAIDNTTGLAATTVTSATAGLSISYQNTQTGTVTAITLSDLAASNSAWSSGGMKHIAGGVYRLCIPDAAVPATEGARTIISGTATAFQILGCELVGKPVEVVSGSLVAASVSGAVGSVTGAVGSVTGNVGGNVTGSVGSVATGGITAASIAADAIGASELAADAVAEIQSGLATSSDLATLASYVDTEVQAILTAQSDLAEQIATLEDLSAVEAQAAVAAALAAYPVPLIAGIEDAINAGSGATPETFWAHPDRTLTHPYAEPAADDPEGTLQILAGEDWTYPITGLGPLVDVLKLWATCKGKRGDSDARAIFQIEKTDGLLVLRGAEDLEAEWGSVTIDDEDAGDITIRLKAEATTHHPAGLWLLGVKYKTADVIAVPIERRVRIVRAVTERIE